MIQGNVDWRRRAVIRLTIKALRGTSIELEVVLDTGFSEQLSLPRYIVRALGLQRVNTDRIGVADGRVVSVEVYEATIIWAGQERPILVHCMGNTPMVVMSLLEQHLLTMLIVDQGAVTIEPVQ